MLTVNFCFTRFGNYVNEIIQMATTFQFLYNGSNTAEFYTFIATDLEANGCKQA